MEQKRTFCNEINAKMQFQQAMELSPDNIQYDDHARNHYKLLMNEVNQLLAL